MVRFSRPCGLVISVLLSTAAGAAQAHSSSIVQPIYVRLLGAGDAGLLELKAAAERYRLRPVIELAPSGPIPPRAADELRTARAALQKGDSAAALRALDAAVDDAVRTGGAGLDTASLADIFFLRGTARAGATAAASDLIRAAVLRESRTGVTDERNLDATGLGPEMLEAWKAAQAEVAARPQGEIVVRAPAGATVSLDARPPVAVPATFGKLRFGDHLVRVEQAGRAPWTSVLPLVNDRLEVDVPEQAVIKLDDATAAAAARERGAQFALLLQPRPGEEIVDLRLVDTTGDELRDAAAVPLPRTGSVDQAVMRLDERARKLQVTRMEKAGSLPIVAPTTEPNDALGPSLGTALRENPRGWAHGHWQLVTALGIWVGTALTLGLFVAAGH